MDRAAGAQLGFTSLLVTRPVGHMDEHQKGNRETVSFKNSVVLSLRQTL